MNRQNVLWTLAVSATLGLSACSRFHAKPSEQFVYVTAKQRFLRDRVAAVSNRTGEVNNGERLKVLEHARHFIRVETDKGQIGWIEENAIATPEVAAEFATLKDSIKDAPAVATAVVRDQVYLHVKPGRDAEKFYLLNEGEKLELLRRATLTKVVNQALVARAQRPIPQAAGSNATRKDAKPKTAPTPAASEATPAQSFEDWWLVRDSGGHAGWIYARMMDVDAPEALTRYAEGQRFVGAYVLTTVHDEEAPGDKKDVPIYVTVLSPYKAGLPYDFDQVRVYTWSLGKHRYETGFRERNIEGFLPVDIKKMKDPYGKSPLALQDLPAFTYHVLPGDTPEVPPDANGERKPSRTIAKTYRLEGNIVRRMGAPGSTAGESLAHPVAEEKKDKKTRKRH